jgi:hypothetical protein
VNCLVPALSLLQQQDGGGAIKPLYTLRPRYLVQGLCSSYVSFLITSTNKTCSYRLVIVYANLLFSPMESEIKFIRNKYGTRLLEETGNGTERNGLNDGL